MKALAALSSQRIMTSPADPHSRAVRGDNPMNIMTDAKNLTTSNKPAGGNLTRRPVRENPSRA